ncbi:MAG TPA: twin-arginine translocation signal domain-containing protein [Nocardioides sp.]|nr:twin-arginine translocation signal domain-containing protein [Nocardioides sp.]
MSETNRRNFLAAAGAGAAAVGTVAVTAGTARATEARRKKNSAQETVVAYVKDHRSSELRLMVGEREVIVNDRDLVTRILNAAGGN